MVEAVYQGEIRERQFVQVLHGLSGDDLLAAAVLHQIDYDRFRFAGYYVVGVLSGFFGQEGGVAAADDHPCVGIQLFRLLCDLVSARRGGGHDRYADYIASLEIIDIEVFHILVVDDDVVSGVFEDGAQVDGAH